MDKFGTTVGADTSPVPDQLRSLFNHPDDVLTLLRMFQRLLDQQRGRASRVQISGVSMNC